jgi:shikimate kinase
MKMEQHLILAGFMGAGKSTIGRRLSKSWQVPFYDLDYRIEQSEEMSIPKIFNHKGEEYFRAVELDELKKLSDLNPGVVALGGGALQSDEVIDFLKGIGRLVYLNVPFEVLMKRIGHSERPLVQQNGQADETLKQRFEERQRFYRQADFIISVTENESIEETASKVEDIWS